MAHVGTKQKLVAAGSAFIVLILYMAVVFVANDDPSVPIKVFSEIQEDPEQNFYGQWDRNTDEEIKLYPFLQLVKFDAIEGTAAMRVFPFPGESWGRSLWSSFEPDRTFTVNVDSVGSVPLGEDSGNCSEFEAGFVYGACDYILDVPARDDMGTKSISYYPFDKYIVPFAMEARIGDGKTYEDEKNWEYLAVRPVEYTGRVGDFQAIWTLVDYDKKEIESTSAAYSFLDEGGLAVDVTMTRSISTKMIVVVLLIFNLGAACMLAVMAWSVFVGHRPPTLGSLVWGAATIFTMLQSRQDIFPSNPPVGVWMDLWFFFPALFVSLLSTSALFALWIRRSDWMA
jgi:hypothetical protein